MVFFFSLNENTGRCSYGHSCFKLWKNEITSCHPCTVPHERREQGWSYRLFFGAIFFRSELRKWGGAVVKSFDKSNKFDSIKGGVGVKLSNIDFKQKMVILKSFSNHDCVNPSSRTFRSFFLETSAKTGLSVH
jgi:hypothetical protein